MDERTNESAKPLPCPFCGEEPYVYEFLDKTGWQAWCQNERCVMRPTTRIRNSREEALADWNGRAGDA